jgi:aminopeptidase YwaD
MFSSIRYLALTLCFSASLWFNVGLSQTSRNISKDDILHHIKYLASDELAGRFPGTAGDSLAEDYVIKQFKEYKLKPLGDDGFKERFDYVSETKMGTRNSFSITFPDEVIMYEPGADFTPLGLSGIGSVDGKIVFVGYGISAPDLNYDDLKAIDLNGKIALVLRYSPGYNNPHDNPFSKYERTARKCNDLKKAGAKGIIFVLGPQQSGEDELMKILSGKGSENVGIPVISVKTSVAERIFTSAGKNLGAIQKEIDSLRTSNSFDIPSAKANMETDLIYVNSHTANILGFLEGSDPVLKKETVVIGAHLDHLGDGMKYGSLYEKHEPAIHNGADDNASGSAGVLELAQKMSSEKKKFKRSYLFMLFSGEEAGLIGSAHFTKSDRFKNLNIVSMINMDMVGRLTDNKLIINGTGTSTLWKPMLDSLNRSFQFTMAYKEEGFGPSDYSSFYAKDVPVLAFFTGLHKDYHRPSDDWEFINGEGEEKILKYVYEVAKAIDGMSTKPDYVKTKEEKEQTMTGFRVTLGVMPDYSSTEEGLAIMGVKPEGAADNAGLKAGDIIVRLGTHEIKNIYDYTEALGEFKPGDETQVVVKRGSEELTLNVKFTGK